LRSCYRPRNVNHHTIIILRPCQISLRIKRTNCNRKTTAEIHPQYSSDILNIEIVKDRVYDRKSCLFIEHSKSTLARMTPSSGGLLYQLYDLWDDMTRPLVSLREIVFFILDGLSSVEFTVKCVRQSCMLIYMFFV
jgi:hypothetical protein